MCTFVEIGFRYTELWIVTDRGSIVKTKIENNITFS